MVFRLFHFVIPGKLTINLIMTDSPNTYENYANYPENHWCHHIRLSGSLSSLRNEFLLSHRHSTLPLYVQFPASFTKPSILLLQAYGNSFAIGLLAF
jgi:hypothetical protein